MSKKGLQTPERAAVMLALWQSGMTYSAIAAQYDLSRERVRQILNKTQGFTGYDHTPLYRTCEDCGDRRLTHSTKDAAIRWCRGCAGKHRMKPPLHLTCSKCGTAFTLQGTKRSMYLNNVRRQGVAGAWCPECCSKRESGPYQFPCTRCGKTVERPGPKGHFMRYLHREGRVQRSYCTACFPIWQREHAADMREKYKRKREKTAD